MFPYVKKGFFEEGKAHRFSVGRLPSSATRNRLETARLRAVEGTRVISLTPTARGRAGSKSEACRLQGRAGSRASCRRQEDYCFEDFSSMYFTTSPTV